MNNEDSWNLKSIKRLAARIRNGRAILGNYPGMTREQQDLLFHMVIDEWGSGPWFSLDR